MKHELLRMEHIFKVSSGVNVLDDFNMNVYKGEVLFLIGLSGSGKAFLANILEGTEGKDSGTIYFDEQKVEIGSKSVSKKLGIYCIHEESQLVPQLSVAENIFVIKDNSLKKILLNKKAIESQTKLLLDEIGLNIAPDTPAISLTLAQQHLIELARARAAGAKLIVMEEFTGSYTLREANKLVEIILRFKDAGITFLIETHKTEDMIFDFSDRIVVMRDGKNVRTLNKDEFNKDYIFGQLVGREFSAQYRRKSRRSEKETLRIQELSSPGRLDKISLNLYKGEILGVLDMENRSNIELVDVLTGNLQQYTGKVYLDGVKVEIRSLEHATQAGIGLITEDETGNQLIENLNFSENLAFMLLKKIKKYMVYIKKDIIEYLNDEHKTELGIDERNARKGVAYLDVYTKLKILYLKWILFRPKVLICIKPFSLADVVMKDIIVNMLDKAAAMGIGIIIISSELAEVSAVCDRIVVLAGGRMKGQYTKNDIPELEMEDLY